MFSYISVCIDMLSNFPVFDRIIINLKIVSNIQPGQKLIVDSHHNFYIDRNFFQSIIRYAWGNSRQCTCVSLKMLLDDVSSIMDLRGWAMNQGLSTDLLRDARKGLLNLQSTYEDDNETNAAIARLIEQLQTIINASLSIDSPNIRRLPKGFEDIHLKRWGRATPEDGKGFSTQGKDKPDAKRELKGLEALQHSDPVPIPLSTEHLATREVSPESKAAYGVLGRAPDVNRDECVAKDVVKLPTAASKRKSHSKTPYAD